MLPLPAVLTGGEIDPAWANTTLNDIAAALTQSISKDGQTVMTGALNMGGQAISGAGAMTSDGVIMAASFSSTPTGAAGLAIAASLNAAVAASIQNTNTGASAVAQLWLANVANTAYLQMQGTGANSQLAGGLAGSALNLYTNAAIPIQFGMNNALAGTIGVEAEWSIPAPTAMTPTLTLSGVPSYYALALPSGSGAYSRIGFGANGAVLGVGSFDLFQDASGNAQLLNFAAASLIMWTSGAQRALINAAGNFSINAPASGIALTVGGIAGNYASNFQASTSSGTSYGLEVNAGTTSADICAAFANAAGSADYLLLYGDGGVVVGSPTGGDKGLGTVNATALYVNGAAVLPGIPQNAQSGSTYTLALTDNGKSVYATFSGAKGITIPANASVAFPIGAAVTFVNNGTGAMSILITSDTMTLANSTSTGTRSLAVNGVATALKLTATSWIISGTGLS